MNDRTKNAKRQLTSVGGSEWYKKLRERFDSESTARFNRAEAAKAEANEDYEVDATVQAIADNAASDICRLIPEDATHFIVLRNLELVAKLIGERNGERKVPPENIVFISEMPIKNRQANYYGVQTVLFSKEGIGVDNPYQTVKNTLEQGIQAMKFDKLAVVMNPPYQVSDGGNGRSSKMLYNVFIETIIDDLPVTYLVSINPSRWFIGGKGLDSFRARMMADRRLKVIQDFPGQREIFPSVDIAGGINYFLWDRNYNGPCTFNGVDRFLDEEDTIIRENDARPILKKVKSKVNKWISECASARKPYGVPGNATPATTGTPCHFKQCIGLNGLAKIDPSNITDQRNDLNTWRVLVPRVQPGNLPVQSGGFFNRGRVIIAKPGEACTDTYIVLKSVNSEKAAKNFVEYIYTRFFRFMLRMRTVSADITRENYAWIPDLDCSKVWTDMELYKLFNLSRKEVEFIESNTREMSK